jgi:hypothetical protein
MDKRSSAKLIGASCRVFGAQRRMYRDKRKSTKSMDNGEWRMDNWKNKKMKGILIGSFFLLLLSCGKDPKTAVREIESGSFHTLTIDNRFDVILTQGSTESVTVSGHPSLIEKVSCSLTDGELRVTSSFKSAWLRPKNNRVTIYITVVELKRLNINETGSLVCTNELLGDEIGLITTGKLADVNLKLNCATFYYWNNFPCSGKISLSGNCTQLKIWNHALMQVDAKDLLSNNSLIENFSKGDVTVSPVSQLVYRIAGEGNIRVNGTPSFVEILGNDGTGKLIYL